MDFHNLTPQEKYTTLMAGVNNNPDNAYTVGNALQAGAYGPAMTAYAHNFYRIAGFGSNAQAMFAMGMCYAQGEGGVYADPDQAMGWFKRAAEKDVPEAQRMLQLFDSPQGKQLLLQSAIGDGSRWYVYKALVDEFYRMAREEEDVDYMLEIAARRADPRLTGPFVYDIDEAVKWYTTAAEWKVPEAMLALGKLYLTGSTDPEGKEALAPDRTRARHWLGLSADTGDLDAYALLLKEFPEMM